MLVEVVCLRHAGAKLPRERVASLPRVRGELAISRRRDGWRNAWVPMAALRDGASSEYLLPPLDDVRVMRWRGVDLVLVGWEGVEHSRGRRVQAQAWWCRLLGDPSRP